MIPYGIETATSRCVAQHLDHCASTVLHSTSSISSTDPAVSLRICEVSGSYLDSKFLIVIQGFCYSCPPKKKKPEKVHKVGQISPMLK